MRGRKRIATTAGLLLVLAVAVAAATAGETTGLTNSTIKIGVLAPITGVQAHFGSSIKTVTELMAKEVNEAGGIHGRKLELIVEDEACSGTKARAAVNKLIFRDQVFAVFGGTCAAAIVPTVPVMVENQTPYMTPMVIAEKLTDPFNKYVFRVQVPATVIGRLMVAYGIERFGAKRVAIVSQDDEYGAGELKGSLLELKRRSFAPVAHETHKVGDTDFSAQALRLKQANPDLVIIHSYAPQTAALVKKAFELGVRAQYVAGVASGITRITELIGDEASRGAYSAISVVVDPTGKNHPLTKDFVARYAKEYPEHSKRPGIPGPGEFQVLSGAAVFIEGLKRAGRDLTRDKFIQALETIRNMETGGYRSVSFSKDNHDGVLSAHFWHYDKDGAVRVTEKAYTID